MIESSRELRRGLAMEQELEKAASVFEFLYADRARLAHLLSQLTDDGIVATSKRVASRSSANTGGFKLSAGIASGNGDLSDQATESLENVFDASWMLPSNALLVLQENGLIQTGPPYSIGCIAQIKGSLSISDISLVKLMWETVSEQALQSIHQSQKKIKRQEFTRTGQVVKDLPDTVQAVVRSGNYAFWSLLDNKDPTFSTHAVSLKYGSQIQGEWYLIGILDAMPDASSEATQDHDIKSPLEQFGEVSDNLRTIIGRPSEFYGVTPLAIFRPINIPTHS